MVFVRAPRAISEMMDFLLDNGGKLGCDPPALEDLEHASFQTTLLAQHPPLLNRQHVRHVEKGGVLLSSAPRQQTTADVVDFNRTSVIKHQEAEVIMMKEADDGRQRRPLRHLSNAYEVFMKEFEVRAPLRFSRPFHEPFPSRRTNGGCLRSVYLLVCFFL